MDFDGNFCEIVFLNGETAKIPNYLNFSETLDMVFQLVKKGVLLSFNKYEDNSLIFTMNIASWKAANLYYE